MSMYSFCFNLLVYTKCSRCRSPFRFVKAKTELHSVPLLTDLSKTFFHLVENQNIKERMINDLYIIYMINTWSIHHIHDQYMIYTSYTWSIHDLYIIYMINTWSIHHIHDQYMIYTSYTVICKNSGRHDISIYQYIGCIMGNCK